MEIFEGFFRFISGILNFFYTLIPNYGVAIILLTITVMAVITPLTLKSTRSMMQMQRLQPEMKKLQEKHKGDREKLNTELMAFYKENSINPLSGCVPVLAQMPVFIVLYQVIRGITWREGGTGSGTGHVSGQTVVGEPLTPWALQDQPFDPQHLNENTELYQSLSNTNDMNFFGMDLSLSPSQALQISIITAIPFLLLMGGMLVSQIFQNRQIQGRSQNQSTPPQQQAIMKILPFMLPVISFSFPAGLGLYYFVQGLCRLGTQAYITKKFYGEGSAAAVVIDTDGSEKPDDAIEAAAVDADDGSPASGTTASGKAASGKAKTKGGTKKQASSNGQGSSGNGKKPGNSTKSQAVQKKKDQGSTPSSGRKSGSPRTGGGRRSGQS